MDISHQPARFSIRFGRLLGERDIFDLESGRARTRFPNRYRLRLGIQKPVGEFHFVRGCRTPKAFEETQQERVLRKKKERFERIV